MDYDRIGEPNGKDLIARGWRACCPRSAGARSTSAAGPGGMRCCSRKYLRTSVRS